MYAPTTEVVDAGGNRVALTHLVQGKDLLTRERGGLKAGVVRRVYSMADPLSVTIATAYGRRLTVAGGQRILVHGKGGRAQWLRANVLDVGHLLYAVADGMLVADKVTCIIRADGRHEPWITVSSTTGNLFAEEILCRAS